MAGVKLVIGCLAAIVASFFLVDTAFAATCKTYEVVYARGSGQKVTAGPNDAGYEKEREALRDALGKNIDPNKFAFTELDGTALGLVEDYKAIKVTDESFGVGFVSVVNKAQFGKYSESLNGGVGALREYLLKSSALNKERCYILTGYSQGAHVIGEALSRLVDRAEVVERIAYIGLIGDPKLDLDGINIIPGKDVPWYRGTAIPLVQGGILGNRKPYLPYSGDQLTIPSGSWCFSDDVVCSSNFFAASSGAHGKYPERAIPQMALEIASIINNPDGIVSSTLRPKETCGPAKQDIVVLLDTSPMMRRDASLFTDTPMYYGAENRKPLPTAGQTLLRSGCGDTRLAVVGYGRAQDGPPTLLLNFTKNATDYDALLKSLYQPSSSGTYERTQFREGALKAMDVAWREDTGKIVLAMTDIAGSGSAGPLASRGWQDSEVRSIYLTDPMSQTLIAKARERDAIVIGIPIQHAYTGYAPAIFDSATTDAHSYMAMVSKATGGYYWPKLVPSYNGYNFKYSLLDTTIDYVAQIREKTVATIPVVAGKVGESLTLRVGDPLSLFAAAALRQDNVQYAWRLDCENKTQQISNLKQQITYIPSKPGACLGSVEVSVKQGTGAGCYNGCPEPFPPYMHHSFPIRIDIKPADYIPKVPGQITNLQKTIFSNKVEYSWDSPATNGDQDIVYVIRENDGTVLATTTEHSLIVTDTHNDDPSFSVTTVGTEGKSEPVSSITADVLDLRPPEDSIVKLDPVAEDTPVMPGAVSGAITSMDTPEFSAPNSEEHLTANQPNDEVSFVAGASDEVKISERVIKPAEASHYVGSAHEKGIEQGLISILLGSLAALLAALAIRKILFHAQK